MTVLGDIQKSEMQPQICLDAHLLGRDPLFAEALFKPSSPRPEAVEPTSQVQEIPKKAGEFLVLIDSGK